MIKQYFLHHDWKVIEEGFNPEMQEVGESIFSLGNGKMGQRANMEEYYSGHSLSGQYVAGVYYPDKTRVGWWKNGYPEYFAKVLNSPNWMDLDLYVNEERLDLAKNKILSFRRWLDMRESTLYREVIVEIGGCHIKIESIRFFHIDRDHLAAMRYQISLLEGKAQILLSSGIDGNVKNKDANYDEVFWNISQTAFVDDHLFLQAETKKTAFVVGYGVSHHINKKAIEPFEKHIGQGHIWQTFNGDLKIGEQIEIDKFFSLQVSLYEPPTEHASLATQRLNEAKAVGFANLHLEHKKAWESRWKYMDIQIKGDTAAQQGIRFNILQLNHTYTGRDPRLNIGPKGFTGEKYGGSTYWDTEAYCLPFYLSTAPHNVARQLLQYRFKHLAKAIENAEKLGFRNGAALYPMVTMNGEECHNEWEITFEEIHRNGAIAFAIYQYIEFTQDVDYLLDGGLEVLVGIARFWNQRVNWSEEKQAWVMLGVTGPNEYENNINNNWYTNYLASWCLKYAAQSINQATERNKQKAENLIAKLSIKHEEIEDWRNKWEGMFLPRDKKRQIWLQQEGFLDKEIKTVVTLNPKERPINQHWSWDRILRSCFIKQADVLQGLYFFEQDFSEEEIRRNFDFYEPITVHESSLSPCVHSILATKLGYDQKAYEFYLRTSRLDLDDYNKEVAEGLHITSMAGTWLSVVQGFGGMRVINQELHFNPRLPAQWQQFSFKVRFLNRLIEVNVERDHSWIALLEGDDLKIYVHSEPKLIEKASRQQWNLRPKSERS